MPERLQLRRSKGWRLREGAVVVSRPTKFGNPFKMDEILAEGAAASKEQARQVAVERFRDWLLRGERSEWWTEERAGRHAEIRRHLPELRGKDLACWCPVPGPCHADVLLELANQDTATSERE